MTIYGLFNMANTPNFTTLVKGLKFKFSNIFSIYFYFLNKDHELAYFNMLVPCEMYEL